MPVAAEWDAPPEYPDLTTASKNSLIKVLYDAHRYFFVKGSSLPPKYLEVDRYMASSASQECLHR